MQAADWASIIGTGLALLGALAAGLQWAKKYLRELTPNGGSSLNDTIKLQMLPLIKEMSSDITGLKISTARLEGRFEQHIIESE